MISNKEEWQRQFDHLPEVATTHHHQTKPVHQDGDGMGDGDWQQSKTAPI